MRSLLAVLLVPIVCVIAIDLSLASQDTIAQNVTERSWIYVNGYMDDSRIYQTQKGFHGQKLVMGSSGSGTATRTIDSQVYSDSNMEEISFTVSADYDYKPYVSPLTQSDLRNALCAKNYEVGSVFSERYSNVRDLIKDTTIYQNNQVSVYDINSEVQGTARIGSRVQKNLETVPSYIMGGTYIGYSRIEMEVLAGNTSILTLPCP